MGSFTAGPLVVADAPGYDTYNSAVMQAMRQLATEGRLADVAALDDFLELSDRIRRAVSAAATQAAGRGAAEFEVAVPMSRSEHLVLGAMGPTLQVVLEIATMRGTIDTSPPPAAFRLMTALGKGVFAQ